MTLQKRTLLVGVIIIQCFTGLAQHYNSPTPFYGYYYDYKLANPAFTGTKAKHLINSVFHGLPDGVRKTVYASYEADLRSIKSGMGAVFLYDELGAVSNAQSGLLYSKQLPFDEKSGLQFGTQLIYNVWKIDYHKFRSLDGSDGNVSLLLPEKRRSFNVDFGVAYYSSHGTIGASVKNIFKENKDDFTQGIVPSMVLVAMRDITITNVLKVTPSAFFATDFDDNQVIAVNATFEIKKWVMVGGGYQLYDHDSNNLDLNLGVNINDWVQVVAHLYSSANYRLRDYKDPVMETFVRVKVPHKVKTD